MVAARQPHAIPMHDALIERSAWYGCDSRPDPLPPVGCPPIPARRSVDLRLRTHAVYVWLWRYVQVYGTAPSTLDIAKGVDMVRAAAADALHDLMERGCLVLVGDGWIPVEAP